MNAGQFPVAPHEGLPHAPHLRPVPVLLERFPVITLIGILSPWPSSVFVTLAGEGLQSLSPWLAGSPYPFRVGGSTWEVVRPLVCPCAGSSLPRRLGLAHSRVQHCPPPRPGCLLQICLGEVQLFLTLDSGAQLVAMNITY